MRAAVFLMCAAAVGVVVYARIRLLEVPFERDEGEYAYGGWLLLQGILPFDGIYNMKMPGVYAIFALMLACLGQTHSAVHLGLLIANAASAGMVFLLGSRLFNRTAGAVAGACFTVLSISISVQGLFAHAEHFVVLSAVTGLLLLLHAQEKRSLPAYFLSGVCLGTGFAIKQHGAAFVLFAGLYIAGTCLRNRGMPLLRKACVTGLYTAGALMPSAIIVLILFLGGVFDTFWFWTVTYARSYTSSILITEGAELLAHRSSEILSSAPCIWAAALAGVSACCLRSALTRRLFLIALTLFSLLAVCPGFYFRFHYFVLVLPVAALLAGFGIASFHSLLSRLLPHGAASAALALLTASILVHSVYIQRSVLFNQSPRSVSRMTYGYNPFPESLDVAEYLQRHTAEHDRIAVLGSEPQIYFYARRRAATGYIYMYPLMEDHPYAEVMQREMIEQIETARPRFLVFVTLPVSWLRRADSYDIIFKWCNRFIHDHYDSVKLFHIESTKHKLHIFQRRG